MRPLPREILPLVALAVLSSPATLNAAPPLPAIGGEIARAWMTDVTDNGIVAGLDYTTGPRAFMWQDGVRTIFDRDTPLGGSIAVAANRHGQVVGFQIDLVGKSRPILWDHGTRVDLMAELGPHRDGPGDGVALAINDRGQVVFAAQPEVLCRCPNAFLWDRGHITDLGPTTAWVDEYFIHQFSGSAPVLAINEHGDVIGDDGAGSFLWRDGVRTALPFRAAALNDRGQVVGGSFLWDDGELTSLPAPGPGGTFAQVINNHGEVAGVIGPARTPDPLAGEGAQPRVFRWRNGSMELMPTSGWSLPWSFAVTDINERGQVAGINNIYETWGYLGGPAMARGPSLFLWDGDRVVDLEAGLDPLGHPLTSRGVRLTGSGQAIFNHLFQDEPVTYLWDGGVATPLKVRVDAPAVETPSPISILLPRRVPALPLEPPMARGLGVLRVVPNPAFGPIEVHLELPESVLARATVLDLQGRHVRSLSNGDHRTLSWDGRDEAGRLTPAGIYVVRVEAGARVYTTRMLRVR